MNKYEEKIHILNKFFELGASRKNEGFFSLHKIEQAKLLELLCTKEPEYLEVNLEELYEEFKKTRK